MLAKEVYQDEREFMFTGKDFSRVRSMIYKHAGISLSEAKSDMVYSRVGRRLRALNYTSFKSYLDDLDNNEQAPEWELFTNALTTNLTSFFREEHHFPILAEHLLTLEKPIKLWCSAASTGEEPYSMAITACETFGTLSPPVEIIATDIDTNVLQTAARGVYDEDRISKLTNKQRKTYFQKGTGEQEGLVRIKPALKKLVRFQKLNLLDKTLALDTQFDAIFCRNVMIYFDKPTQQAILKKFLPLMKSNTLLFAGHSENFLYVSDALSLLGKTVYRLKSKV